MKSKLNHIQINVSNPVEALPFYKKLLTYFEYHMLMDSENMLGMSDGNTSIWFSSTTIDNMAIKNSRDGNGLNHIAFSVDTKEDVDKFVNEFMAPNGIQPKWQTPRLRDDFTGDKGIYYQVMFETLDGVAVEVVYMKWDF